MRGIEGNRAASREGRKGGNIGGRSRIVILLKTPFMAAAKLLPQNPCSRYSYLRVLCIFEIFAYAAVQINISEAEILVCPHIMSTTLKFPMQRI